MPVCQQCQKEFKNCVKIDGVMKNVSKRKYCLECSPFGLHNTRPLDRKIPYGSQIVCQSCGKIFLKTLYKNKCNDKCSSCRYKERRLKIKDELIALSGGKCCVCGYSRCTHALQFHHKDPTLKEFNLSGNCTWAINKVLEELKKCALICANCHAELHAGLIKLQ